MNFYVSLGMVTNLGWIEDVNEEEFDGSLRKLTGDPALPIDRWRQLYNHIKRNEYPNLHADRGYMDKQVNALRQIVAKVVLLRMNELRAGN